MDAALKWTLAKLLSTVVGDFGEAAFCAFFLFVSDLSAFSTVPLRLIGLIEQTLMTNSSN